eukprot:c1780_g1_i1 orf=40-240(+)
MEGTQGLQGDSLKTVLHGIPGFNKEKVELNIPGTQLPAATKLYLDDNASNNPTALEKGISSNIALC